jgi:hypothetical protein
MADGIEPGIEPFTARDEFPVAALPKWARDYVIALSYVLQVEPVVVALSVLGATALAVQGKAELAVRGGWVEPLAFWSLTALRSGNRKTPALLRPLAPVREYERDENLRRAAYRERIRARKQQTTGKGKGKPDPSEGCPFAAAEPPDLELFASDCTPEAIALALSEQQEAYAVVTDEPTTLAEILGGLYSEGKGANTGIYMAGYSGSPYRRKRAKGQNAILERPTLSMMLIGQPEVFQDLTSRAALVALGFVGRFLVCKPIDHLGNREIHDESVPEGVLARYREAMLAMLRVQPKEPLPDTSPGAWMADPPDPWPKGSVSRHRLQLTDEARILHSDVEAQIEPLLDPRAALGELSDFGAKLSGQIARCAALLHAMAHGADYPNHPIDAETMGRAIEIGRFALGEVLRIFSDRAVDREDQELAEYVGDALDVLSEKNRNDSFTWAALRRRFLSSGGRSRIGSADDLLAVLEELERRGEIEEVATVSGKGRRWRVKRRTH